MSIVACTCAVLRRRRRSGTAVAASTPAARVGRVVQGGIVVPIRGGIAPLSRASLPWYDFEPVAWATDALWRGLAARLRAGGMCRVPDVRRPSEDYETDWHHPDLLFSQCCG